jgi:gliding motility-associated-like protein
MANEGQYNLTITINGCTGPAASSRVFVNQPAVADAGSNQTLCISTKAVNLSGTVSGGSRAGIWSSSGAGTFLPSATSLNAIYIPSQTDIATAKAVLTLTSTNNGGCAASVSSVTITFQKLPVVMAGNDQSVCSNNSVVSLNGSVSFASGGTWSSSGTGTFTPSVTALNAAYVPSPADIIRGSVMLMLHSTGNNLCSAVADTMNVTIVPATPVSAGADKLTLQRTSVTLSPQVSEPDAEYLWTPNINLSNNRVRNPVFTGMSDQLYTLTVTNKYGCVTEDQVLVKVLRPITIPNTFTPNGDGVNDAWNIDELEEYPEASVDIFNRYGEKIHTSAGYYKAWDGTFKGKPMPEGTYYYLIDTKFGNIYSGPISVLR